MANYWASKNPIPFADADESQLSSYVALCNVKSLALGLSVKQGQIDIYGAIEMLGGLQYHYQQFMRIRRQKLAGSLSLDAPDERFEAVAYVNRIGQLHY
ncbi:MAG TPA: hypothetical protein VIM02_02370, partial [Rhizomicrobium sp.]